MCLNNNNQDPHKTTREIDLILWTMNIRRLVIDIKHQERAFRTKAIYNKDDEDLSDTKIDQRYQIIHTLN